MRTTRLLLSVGLAVGMEMGREGSVLQLSLSVGLAVGTMKVVVVCSLADDLLAWPNGDGQRRPIGDNTSSGEQM